MKPSTYSPLDGTRVESFVSNSASHLFTLLSLYGSSSTLWPHWDREGLCVGGNTALATTLTHKRAAAAGQQEWRSWAGNGVNPLLEAVSCPWAKRVYLSSDQSSLCACVHRSTHVSGPKTVQTSHGRGIHKERIPLPLWHMPLINTALQHVAFFSKIYSLLIW